MASEPSDMSRPGLLTILADREVTVPSVSPGERVVGPDELKSWVRSGQVLRHALGYRQVRLLAADARYVQRPLRAALVLRVLSRGTTWLEGYDGYRVPIRFGGLLRLVVSTARDLVALRGVRRRLESRVAALPITPAKVAGLDLSARPIYLKTDMVFGIKAGGSVAHTAGVLNHLNRFAAAPKFLTPVCIPTVRSDIDTELLVPSRRFWEFPGLPPLLFNHNAYRQSVQALVDVKPAFLYQRYCAYNYVGVQLSWDLAIPYVLEYNGSEIWINRNWGKPLAYEELGEKVEMANLLSAHLIVVVSQPMKDELVTRGVASERILVNANGVDPAIYHPDVDGAEIRCRLGLGGRTVVGFIGTFGRWHGAEVLVNSFAAMVGERPDLRERVRLMLVGDGQQMPSVREAVKRNRLEDVVVVTGLVPHEEGPRYLAACDIYASPHVPNPDGSRFFGSPTKLFEYMAMGRGIVASELDQIGEVLEHEKTAWLVEPGSVVDLAAGLRRLIEDRDLREQLGRQAREVAAREHSWEAHTGRIVERLVELMP